MSDMWTDNSLLVGGDRELGREYLNLFKLRFKVERASSAFGPPTLRRYRGQRHFVEGTGESYSFTLWDHARLWFPAGSRRAQVYTCEPYDLSGEKVASILAYCTEHDLDLRIDSGSWHNPGSTVLVIVRVREKVE